MTPASYTAQLINLLPRGDLWDGLPTVKAVLAAWAEELSRIHGRIDDLVREADPLQAVETLEDWERVLHLPDPGMPVATTIEERQQAVLAKLISSGGQSRAYYVALATALGYAVHIVEFDPFTTESTTDDVIYDEGWAYTWMVVVDEAPEGRFVDGHCLDLEVVMAAGNQSHLSVCFDYSALEA